MYRWARRDGSGTTNVCHGVLCATCACIYVCVNAVVRMGHAHAFVGCVGLTVVCVLLVRWWAWLVWWRRYHWMHLHGLAGARLPVQSEGAPKYSFFEGVMTHFSQPEGFVLLGGYLCGTWMFHLMPASYYSFEGTIVYARLCNCSPNYLLCDLPKKHVLCLW